MRTLTPLLLLLQAGLLMLTLRAAEPDNWHHGTSDYRAVFSYAGTPPPQAGVLLQVPVASLGDRDGRDIFCFDQHGRQLLGAVVGAAIGNSAIIVCRPEPETRRILAYFGSGKRAPQARIPVHGGLLGEVRALPPGVKAETWPELSRHLPQAPLVGRFLPDKWAQVSNPVDSRQEFILSINGFLLLTAPQTPTWFVSADDSGYLLLNNALQIERPGRNYIQSSLRGEFKKSLSLTAGIHQVSLIGVNFGGTFALALGQLPGGRRVEAVGLDHVVDAGKAVLQTVQTRLDGQPNPLFRYRHASYMSLGDTILTETVLSTWSDQEATWTFSDGLVLRGNSVRRVFAGLADRQVRVSVRRTATEGSITFPEAAPAPLEAGKADDYQHYFALIAAADVSTVDDVRLLLAYFDLLQRRQLCAEQIPVCTALLALRALSEARRPEIMLALARCSAVARPDQAGAAYEQLLALRGATPLRQQALLEAVAFALFARRDNRQAERWLNQYGRLLGREPLLAAAVRLDLALQQGENSAAGKALQAMLDTVTGPDQQRRHAVQGNALKEQIALALKEGRLLDAQEKLSQLLQTLPSSRTDGSYSLLRARLFRQFGWFDGAMAELDAAILFDPLLPNLPEVEYERVRVLVAAGNRQKAEELLGRIRTEYPNHPLASRRKLPEPGE